MESNYREEEVMIFIGKYWSRIHSIRVKVTLSSSTGSLHRLPVLSETKHRRVIGCHTSVFDELRLTGIGFLRLTVARYVVHVGV